MKACAQHSQSWMSHSVVRFVFRTLLTDFDRTTSLNLSFPVFYNDFTPHLVSLRTELPPASLVFSLPSLYSSVSPSFVLLSHDVLFQKKGVAGLIKVSKTEAPMSTFSKSIKDFYVKCSSLHFES